MPKESITCFHLLPCLGALSIVKSVIFFFNSFISLPTYFIANGSSIAEIPYESQPGACCERLFGWWGNDGRAAYPAYDAGLSVGRDIQYDRSTQPVRAYPVNSP